MGRAAKSPKAKVAAKRPAAAKSAKKKKPLARDVGKALASALAQQKATNEILRVMSASPSDVQPVLDAIARRAARLCDAPYARILLIDRDVLRQRADYSSRGRRVADPARPVPLLRSAVVGRAALDRRTIHITDLVPLLDREYPDARANANTAGFRTILAVPLTREGRAYGGILVYRRVVRRFTRDQVALIETFARQAAIAIDNVRLFHETKEALEQQTATSDILRVISRSQTDVQPVFDTIAGAALKLCNANSAVVTRFDGELIRLVALANVKPEAADTLRRRYPRPPSRDTGNSRAILTGKVVSIPDVLDDAEYAVGAGATTAPFRSILAVPLLRDGSPIGAISVTRDEPGRFSEKQVSLLETFADQAVIAVENVRLFNETRDALEQQTATAHVLQAISSSPGNLQPVFDTLVRAAAQFCGAQNVLIMRVEGPALRVAAGVGPYADSLIEHVGSLAAIEIPLTKDSVSGRAALELRSIHVHDLAVETEEEYPVGRDLQRRWGHRTCVATPLVREGVALGVIGLFRTDVRPFSDKQLQLLSIFADQAVIAIENVRLFTELQARNRELTEALEQQTATSQILRVISESQTDVQPVFDTIVRSVLTLCDATFSAVYLLEGETYSLAATAGLTQEERAAFGSGYPRRIGPDTVSGRAALEGRVVKTADLINDPQYSSAPGSRVGARTVLGVPMLRDGKAIGSIGVWRSEVKPFSDTQIALLQTFADQAVIAIENVRLFKELEQRNSALAESLERQTATSEILRVISQSQTDVQPVFETIAVAVLRLCEATSANVLTFDGTLLHVAALANVNPESESAFRQFYPRPPSRDTAVTRAVLTRSVVAIPDILEDAEYAMQDASLAAGFRSVLGIPLMREGNPIGAIAVGRAQPGPYDEAHIELVKTFADQAVIAIENVRLFNELEQRNAALTESLEQQTATSEILRVIARSPTDTQPVFDLLAQRAGKLCDAEVAVVSRYDGAFIELAAIEGVDPKGVNIVRGLYPMQIDAQTVTARVIRDDTVVQIADVLADRDYGIKEFARAAHYRAGLGVPIVRDGRVIGSIFVGRGTPGLFSDSQVELLKTFADQAVIAIENVRLFKELEHRNSALAESLEQQTATSEILRVISASPRDVQPVFDAIANAALKLCAARVAMVARYDGGLVELAAVANLDPAGEAALREVFPRPPSMETTSCRAVLTGQVEMIPDVLADSHYKVSDQATRAGFRSTLAVPLMRGEHPIGCITVGRPEAGAFSDDQVKLLKTFAEQAVIAIRNVRLFAELDARTAQLSRSVDELKALGEVGQAVSSTLDLGTVLSTIVTRATRLAGMDAGAIYEYDEERGEFFLHTADQFSDELVEALRATPIRKGEGVLGRLAVSREPVQVSDIADAGVYQSRVRKILLGLGHRSLLAIPLLREDRLLGGLSVIRKSTGEFAPDVVALLHTFATQSALAIQNARLFREIEEKSRELETASRHKSEFLANMSHELRTPLNAIIGFSEVLSEKLFGDVNAKQEEYLADILESGRHLLSLINDILDLSKIEAGRMELEAVDFELPSAIDNALTLVRERAGRHGVKLERVVDPRLGTICADERKVKQVLLNLLSNALKFTPEGGRVDVNAHARDGMAEVSVTDTGVGIAPEDQDAVFEEFKQVGSSAKKREGTGLGLAISRKFIELHGGKIWLKSEVGVGSTFTFTLPLPADQHHSVH